MSSFTEGHALIIGVGGDLPNTINDAEGLGDILADAERCAYPPHQVRVLTGEGAARAHILGALDDLAGSVDGESTAVIYFSGHGYGVQTITGTSYFILPYGYKLENLPGTAISGVELAAKLAAIPAKKLLLLLDCCHAGGLDDIKAPGATLSKAPIPQEVAGLLAEGRGKVIIASSRADEKSYAGVPYSAFTLALIEALCGEGVSRSDGFVRVADLALHAREKVPGRTKNRQHPILNYEQADNFRVAYYAAGDQGVKGLPFDVQVHIEQEPGDLNRQILAGNIFIFEQSGQTVNKQINIGQTGEGTQFIENFYAAPPPEPSPAEKALPGYLKRLWKRCNALPLAAMGGEETPGQDVLLEQVYIDLDTTTRVPVSKEVLEQSHVGRDEVPQFYRDEDKPLSALQAAAQSDR
ncbi:MAG: caspase domain-containing protein, partial [Candidatus Promineifilaceae bacterium]